MRTLLFDIDGTLLTTDGAGSRAITSVLQNEFGVEQPIINLDFSGKTDGFLLAELLRQNGFAATTGRMNRFREAYFASFPTTMQQCGGKVLPGVRALLRRCVQLPGIRCFVMTGNCVYTGTKKLQHFDLHQHFSRVFGADHETDRDSLARRTRDSLNAEHDHQPNQPLIVIGDTPADVTCGRSIDALTVAVATGRYRRDDLAAVTPDILCDDLTDPAAIEMILGQSNSAASEDHSAFS